jgi:hypothetical protein
MKSSCTLLAILLVALPATSWAAGGQASFSGDHYGVNWATYPDLTYTITGAPPSVCGDLHTYRNGSWLTSPGWICTDANGFAQKGPWSWWTTPADQTDDSLYIQWPDGSQTNPLHHVWDKNPYTIWRTSANGAPPTSWYGEGSDTTWGAGFDTRWSSILTRYYDVDAHAYWTPNSGGYNVSDTLPGGAYTLQGTFSGIPGSHAYWSMGAQVPPASVHTPGHTYQWQSCLNDPSSSTCLPVYQFVY